MNKLSIILPVYNGGTLVKECVQSILAQTYPEFNLLVLDNHSDDGTLLWIESLKDSRIIIYPSEEKLTMEQNWARVTGIPKNEFMTLIGHDDILHPDYLQEMNILITTHPTASLYQTHFNFINGKGKFIKPCMPMDEMQHGHEFLACQMARTMDSMGTGYMMRSKHFDEVGGMHPDYPNLIFADYQLWVQLSLIGYKATSNKFCFSYRIHNSISKLTNGEHYQQAFEKYIYFIASILKDEKVEMVVEKYGHDFLMYFCESLSHRILKTPSSARKIKVGQFIEKCETLAAIIIPGQKFEPRKKFRITIAEKLDANEAGRRAFQFIKK
ncbi:MAG: glycosyltransferase [Ferruginibacter sp.]